MFLYKKLNLILLFVIVLSVNIIAIGITPGKSTLDFLNTREQKVDFKILNNEHKDMKVVLYTEGELKDLIKLKDEEIRLKSSDNEFLSSYNIKIDKDLIKPGTHSAKIIALDVNENSNSGTSVGLSVAVASLLFVRVPYPNKYVEPDFYMLGENIDQEIRLFVPVTNLGSEKISSTSAVIDIYDANDSKIASVNTESKSLDRMEKRELVSSWHSNVKPGKYYAVIKVNYDGNNIEIKKKFDLGYVILDLIGISVKDFKIGGIAKFNIVIENKVNYPLDDVFASMKIVDSEGDNVGDIKSPITVLSPGKKSSVYTFWDTEGIKPGRFSSDLKINTKDKELQRRLEMLVKDNAIDINIVGYVIKSNESSNSVKLVKPGAIVLLFIIILLFINIYIKKRKRDKPNGFAYRPNKPSYISNDEIKNQEKQIDIPKSPMDNNNPI